jgi:ATP-dependent DNA helicase 2 subunit 2
LLLKLNTTDTNNDTHNNWVKNNPDDDQVYNNIASEVAIQSTKPKLLEAIMNAQVGQNDGNREFKGLGIC